MTKAVSKPRRNAKQVAKPETRQEPDEFDNMATERAMKRLKGVRGRYRVDPQPGDIVRSPHKDETGNALAMFAAFGTTSADFAMNSIAELASVVRGQREFPRRTELNAALAFVDAGEPENEIEAALLVQMAGTHAAAMQALRTSTANPHAATEGGLGNLSVKLMRTFTAQIEALTKLRRGGEQVVRHIHVDNRGGQAVITETVQTGGSRNGKVADQSHATGFEDASGPALLGQDETWHGVPIAGGEGPEKVPNARRDQSGSAEG